MKKEEPNFQFTNKIDLTDLLKENILDNKSRYLMVISVTIKSQIFIKIFKWKNSFLFGSHF